MAGGPAILTTTATYRDPPCQIELSKLVQTGGTAKTTTTAALGVLLSRLGLRVHLVDMDPQASLTQTFGQSDPADRLYVSLKDRAGLPICEVAPNLTLTPGRLTLSRAESELLTEIGREHFLRTALGRTVLPDNTVTLLDCPPSLGVLAVTCRKCPGLSSADSVFSQ